MIGVVTGGRDYQPTPADLAALDAAIALYGCTRIRCGGARGVDTAVYEHLPESMRELWRANWTEGKYAGRGRNIAMLTGYTESSHVHAHPSMTDTAPSVLFAFPGGTGTAHCVAEAQRLGIQVVRINPSSPAKP